jgi:hypothetical protein
MADRFAIFAGFLSAVTGLSVWAVWANSPEWYWQLLVAVVALLASLCALVPRVKNWAEQAGLARELASQYGRLVGDLTDLTNLQVIDQVRAGRVVDDFQITKEKKDQLRGLRDRLVIKRDKAIREAKAATP